MRSAGTAPGRDPMSHREEEKPSGEIHLPRAASPFPRCEPRVERSSRADQREMQGRTGTSRPHTRFTPCRSPTSSPTAAARRQHRDPEVPEQVDQSAGSVPPSGFPGGGGSRSVWLFDAARSSRPASVAGPSCRPGRGRPAVPRGRPLGTRSSPGSRSALRPPRRSRRRTRATRPGRARRRSRAAMWPSPAVLTQDRRRLPELEVRGLGPLQCGVGRGQRTARGVHRLGRTPGEGGGLRQLGTVRRGRRISRGTPGRSPASAPPAPPRGRDVHADSMCSATMRGLKL